MSRTSCTSDEVAELRLEVAALRGELRAAVDRFERAPGPRDAHEVAAVEALALLLCAVESFGAAAAFDLGRDDRDLQDLFDAADLVDVGAMGYLLRNCRGRTFNGYTLIRVGRRWAFAQMHLPCADGPTMESCKPKP